MILNFKKLSDSLVAKILLAILTFSFVIWGISDVFRSGGSANEAARVGNHKISLIELDQSYKQYLNNLRARGMQISNEQAKSMQLAESVLKAKVQREIFNLTAHDMGLIVGDDAAVREIHKQKAFQNDKGEFDRATYNNVLKQNNIREADFVSSLKLDTVNNYLAEALKNNVVVPDALANEIYKAQNQVRSAELRIVLYAAVTAAAPKPEELQNYLTTRAEHYKLPELHTMTVALLTVPALTQKIDINDAEIQSTYEQYKEELKTPEERSFQFISLPDQSVAQKIAESARGGQKLLEAAKEAGAKDVAMKKLDNVKQGTLPEELDKAVFKMGRAETSDAIQTPLGWYVVQILSVKRSEVPALAQIKDKIVKSLKVDKLNSTLPKTLQDLDDAAAGGASLDELAKTYPLTITTLKPVSMDGTDSSGSEVKFTQMKDALKIAADLPKGQTSSPTELPNGDYLIVRMDDVQAARVPELKDIQAQLQADWIADNKEKLALQKADELRAAWQAGKNLDALTKQYGVKSDSLTNIKRGATTMDSRQSADLNLALFDLKKVGDVATGKVASGVAIARLTAITNADPAKVGDAALKPIRDKLAEDAADLQFNTFIAAAERKYPVRINQAAVDRLYGTN